MTDTLRARMELAVERLLAALDAIDAGREDREPDDEDEERAMAASRNIIGAVQA